MSNTDKPRCEAVVYHRDEYRVCRDGKRKFRMHYNRAPCSRAAVENGLCRQHAKQAQTMIVLRWGRR